MSAIPCSGGTGCTDLVRIAALVHPACPYISCGSRLADAWLSSSPAATHDGAVTSTQVCPQGPTVSRRADLASMSGFLVTDLERFWPSRRGHAFDEFCR
jgi:hypothetical protein